jgi:hypothetical protein
MLGSFFGNAEIPLEGISKPLAPNSRKSEESREKHPQKDPKRAVIGDISHPTRPPTFSGFQWVTTIGAAGTPPAPGHIHARVTGTIQRPT